ncbi:MAG: nitroreductase [Acidimicrobiales bacterium]
MDVTTAVNTRASIRSFLPTPVADEQIADLLRTASRAPSGGNVQPWRIYVVNGDATKRLVERVAAAEPEKPLYDVYPANLWEPYRTNRYSLGEAMYETMQIGRDDKAARYAHLARNYEFFGAPAAIFCFLDTKMGPPQWSDAGMFLQTFMLLATEAGLDTCAQEAWANWPQTVKDFVGAPDDEMLFCAVAIGHADHDAPVNSLRSERMPIEEFVTFVG